MHNITVMLSNKNALSSLQQAFIYSASSEQNDNSFTSYMATYSGGGYVANLGDTLTEAQTMIDELERSRWIDPYTRALFVEFNVFNAGSGLANLVLVLLELPTNGDNVWSSRVDIVQLYRYSGLYRL